MSKNCPHLQNDLSFVSSALTRRVAKPPKLRFSVQTGAVNKSGTSRNEGKDERSVRHGGSVAAVLTLCALIKQEAKTAVMELPGKAFLGRCIGLTLNP